MSITETLMPAAGGDDDSADGGRYYDYDAAALANGVNMNGVSITNFEGIGGGGNDTLTGGAGNDIFVIGVHSGTTTTITDFTFGEDALDLTAFKDFDYSISAKAAGTGTDIAIVGDNGFEQFIHLEGYTFADSAIDAANHALMGGYIQS